MSTGYSASSSLQVEPVVQSTISSVPRPTAPVSAVQVTSAMDDDGRRSYYGDGRKQATQILVQCVLVFVAAVLGVIALFAEIFGARSADSGGAVGPAIFGGCWCVAQAVWGLFLLWRAIRARDPKLHGRGPLPPSLVCHSASFTTFTGLTAAGLVPTATICLFINGVAGLVSAIMLYFASAASLAASICGCCATCEAACGCSCCEMVSSSGYRPLSIVAGYEALPTATYGGGHTAEIGPMQSGRQAHHGNAALHGYSMPTAPPPQSVIPASAPETINGQGSPMVAFPVNSGLPSYTPSTEMTQFGGGGAKVATGNLLGE